MKDLLQARDELTVIGNLVETIYMAAVDIADRRQTNAVQATCEVIRAKIDGLDDDLGKIDERVRT